MKTRFDFVTNSSSSSFILGFKSRDEAISQISESLTLMIRAYSKLLEDVTNADPVNKDELIGYLEEQLPYECRREILYSDETEKWIVDHDFQKTRSDYEMTQEYQEEYKREEEWQRHIHKLIGQTPFVVNLCYGSDAGDGGLASIALEEILPNMSYTLKEISHH